MSDPQSLRDLKPASYNPRRISTRQREALVKSYVEYGDLSGIIVNQTTGNIVGGHQRTDVFKKFVSKIVAKPHEDSTGTTALGHVLVPLPNGGTMRIPYRRVKWTRDVEMAANIAANAAGGEFDDVKLGRVLAALQKGRFPIENIPMDGVDIKRATRAFESEVKRNAGIDGEGGEFATIDPKALQELAEHCCPKCNFRWSGSTKPSFGELHRLKDDNPIKIEARRLQKRVVENRRKESREPVKGQRR